MSLNKLLEQWKAVANMAKGICYVYGCEYKIKNWRELNGKFDIK